MDPALSNGIVAADEIAQVVDDRDITVSVHQSINANEYFIINVFDLVLGDAWPRQYCASS